MVTLEPEGYCENDRRTEARNLPREAERIRLTLPRGEKKR